MPPQGPIAAEYDYRDELGTLLFQKVRYAPKTFALRTPDGQGGWRWGRGGVRPVVYRLPELHGKQAVVFAEGEKDVDAAWALGIPATCNPDGASEWDDAYAAQLVAAGVQRVAVIPDNDGPGAVHAARVVDACRAAGLDVRLVALPDLSPQGDLSDYLAAGHSKQDLASLIRTAFAIHPPEKPPAPLPEPLQRAFCRVGDAGYALNEPSCGVLLLVDRVRRSSQELIGELVVRCNGHFPNARTFANGILSAGDLNFSSVQARHTRAKLLAERAHDKDVDWYGLLEEFAVSIIGAERQGTPAIVLADSDEQLETAQWWHVDGWSVLQELPQVLYGDSASGKSLLALWVAGRLAQDGIPVLYADWEFSQREHRSRLGRLFAPMPKGVIYVRCEQPLGREVDHLSRVIREHQCQYLICDSIGFACEGPMEGQEGATGYFRALRQLKIGSLSLTHIPKQQDDTRQPEQFGSNYYKHGARAVWYIQRTKDNRRDEEMYVGLYQKKTNVGPLQRKPLGYKLTFEPHRTYITPCEIDHVEELASNLTALDRITRALRPGAMTQKALAEDTNLPMPTVRTVLHRHKSLFVVIDKKVWLLDTHHQG